MLAGFIFNVLRGQPLPELLLPAFRHNYKALPDRTTAPRGAKAVQAGTAQDGTQAIRNSL